MREVTAHTDGACEPNPGPGGIGVVLESLGRRRELAQGFRLTTNNRMELMAAIIALEALRQPCAVSLRSDSRYLVDAMAGGAAARWAEANWMRPGGRRVPNADLWQRLLEQSRVHPVAWQWIEGHAGDPGNERADALSYAALRGPDLAEDLGYLRSLELEASAPSRITRAGQPCRKCSTPVVRRRPARPPGPGQAYYFEYYLWCPACHTMYMLEKAKRKTGA